MKSKGYRHSQAIKQGIRRRQQTPPMPTERQLIGMEDLATTASAKANLWANMVALLGKLNVGIPEPDEMERQLRLSYKRGYLQALYDIRREAWKQEIATFEDALPAVSKQEAAAISHVFDKSA